MDPRDRPPSPPELPPAARRAVRIIYLAMAILILLPILLVWWTGSFQF